MQLNEAFLTELGLIIPAAFIIMSLTCVAAVLFFERKNPASSLAWLLVLIFLPVLGFIGYLFIGSGFRLNKTRRYQMKAAADQLYEVFARRRWNGPQAQRFADEHPSCARLIKCLASEGQSLYTTDNAALVFTDGQAMFERLLEDLENAREHINLLYFIFNDDDIGRRLASILIRKARQGVQVRLLYDSLGSRFVFTPHIFKELKAAGGQVLGFSPIFSNLSSQLRLNYRNHRKITVIDGRIGYVGGMNVGDEYLGRHKKLKPWRDTHLRLTGPAVWFLQGRFLMDWGYSCQQKPPPAGQLAHFFPSAAKDGSLGVQIVSSGPDIGSSPIKSGLLSMINSARRSIYIQTPYFSPDASLLDALRIAAQSEVDVRLMLPLISDHRLSYLAALSYARQVMEAGVRVFLYHGFLHAKTAVFDTVATTIGTANVNQRSFLMDFEINAFIYDPAFAAQNENIFYTDQTNCTEIDVKWFEKLNPFRKAACNVSRLFSPLM